MVIVPSFAAKQVTSLAEMVAVSSTAGSAITRFPRFTAQAIAAASRIRTI